MQEACGVISDLKLAARFVSHTPANWKLSLITILNVITAQPIM